MFSQNLPQPSRFQFYATLLDAFEGYLNSSRTYQEYWGFSENPSKTEDEFEQEQLQSLIDRINRVPFESEAADKGTAFNEVIDCIIENRNSDKMEIKSFPETGEIAVKYKQHLFKFNLNICVEISKYLSGALTQQFTDGYIETKYGLVRLYGYIDQLLPFLITDLKTTSKYSAFKYKNNWQHKVYPFTLIQNGVNIPEFEYVVTDFKSIWKEHYLFNPEKDIPLLVNHCERFIEFLELHRDKITDTKIFCEELQAT